MAQSKVDVILHPARLKIMQVFCPDVTLTTSEISALLPDLPKGSLYRHLSKLVEAGLITVVEETQIRGAVEKTYALALGHPEQADVAAATNEDHLRYFSTFLMNLLTQFGDYLSGTDVDMAKDGLGYRQAVLHLNDEEFANFLSEYSAVLMKYYQMTPGEGRRKRTLTTIIIPEKN